MMSKTLQSVLEEDLKWDYVLMNVTLRLLEDGKTPRKLSRVG